MSSQRISTSLLRSLSRNIATTTTTRRTSAVISTTKSRLHTSTPTMAQRSLDSQTISEITHKESEALTGQAQPVRGGPAAQAQAHANADLTARRVADIAKGENAVTGQGGPVAGGPAAFAQSEAANARNATLAGKQSHTGKLDSETIARITEAERGLTGQPTPVSGGPTAQAQKHAGEPIGSANLHDITEGEKRVSGADHAVKGGPTSTAQSELSKARAS